MDGNKLLSICLLGYNHAKFIKDCLEAIWNSDYKNIEIIVVDDGSTDNSADVLENMQKISPFPMQVILQQNTGNIGHNLNVALKRAKGEFVYFSSLDDVLYSNQIKKCVDMLAKNLNLAFIASSKIPAINENGVSIPFANLKLDSIRSPSVEDLLNLEYSEFVSFYVQAAFFRKDLVDKVGGFDEDMIGDDITLKTKLFKYIKSHPKYTFKIVQEPVCQYRRHSHNTSRDNKRQIMLVAEYLDRYWPDKKNPEILMECVLYTISNLTFTDSLRVFLMNSRTITLLWNSKVQKKLISKILQRVFYINISKKKKVIRLFGVYLLNKDNDKWR